MDETSAVALLALAEEVSPDLAYTTDGLPPVIGEHTYERLDGNWWHWQEEW